jgi:hypothetical protein
MVRRSALGYGMLSVALVCGGVSAGVFAGLAGAAAATVPGVWQGPEDVPGIAGLNVGRFAGLTVVSCAPGACAGGGFYTDGAGR